MDNLVTAVLPSDMADTSYSVDEATREALMAPAHRGLFIDVKGPVDDLPVLITCCGPGPVLTIQQVVTDMAFADAGLAKDLRVQSFDDLMAELIERAVEVDRGLVTWGAGLTAATERHTDLGRKLATVAIDVRPVLLDAAGSAAASPRKRREPDLADLLRQAGLPIPRHLGSKQSAQRLRYVRQQLRRHDAYASITSTAKAKWTKLLHQGEQDALGLQQLLMALTGNSASMPDLT